jgi:hypothetical protein
MRGGKSPDSHDSYAATFVWACWKYLKASGDIAWLSSPSPHAGYTISQLIKEVIYANLSTQLDPAADNLTKVFQNDGVPFGGTYGASFLMDNCESLAGFYAAQKIYTDFQPEPAYAEQMRVYAEAVATGIDNLWDEQAGAFKYVFGLPTMVQSRPSVFYPLSMSQSWAFLWGVPIDTDRNYRALDYMQANYPQWWERNDVDDLLVLGAHHGLLAATGNQKVRKDILDRIEIERFAPGQADTYVMDGAYYFDIRDSVSVKNLTS